MFQLLGRPRSVNRRDLKVQLLRFEGSTTQSLNHGRDVSRWTGGSFRFSHGALQHQACSGTGSSVPLRVRGGDREEAARSQNLLSEATRHLIRWQNFLGMCSELPGSRREVCGGVEASARCCSRDAMKVLRRPNRRLSTLMQLTAHKLPKERGP